MNKVCCPIKEDYILRFFLIFVNTGIWDELFFLCRGTKQKPVMIFLQFNSSFLNSLQTFGSIMLECAMVEFKRPHIKI